MVLGVLVKIYRQGDVLIIGTVGAQDVGEQIARDPSCEGGRVVLAYGEVTGHAHAIHSPAATLWKKRVADQVTDATTRALVADRVLRLTAEVVLRHEEHDPIVLPAGDYIVRQQREYAPQELRNVAD